MRQAEHDGGPASELLAVERLRVPFTIHQGGERARFYAVDGVSFTVRRAETFAIVGESGSGKSTIANAVVRLIEDFEGRIVIDGADWGRLSPRKLRRARAAVQMVFQNPYGSLNPRWSAGRTIEESLLLHGRMTVSARRAEAERLLALVGMAAKYLARRPKELSGGQRQRVAIARAIACGPTLIVCDEPTAALDVSIQAQVLNLLADLQAASGIAYLFITHDLGIVRHVAHRVAVMYMGQFVELAPTDELFARPLHPYTRTLLDSVPTIEARRAPPAAVAGEPGDAHRPPSGCRLHPRCALATARCASVVPPLTEVQPGRMVACHEWRHLADVPLGGEP